MQVFYHHIYEYQKGIRNLILHTLNSDYKQLAEQKLKNQRIDYFIQDVDDKKINIFFGNSECIEAVKRFVNKSLSELTDEEDFILGIMLGYDRKKQVERYNSRKKIKDDKRVAV